MIDPQIFWLQKYGGISRVFSELLLRLMNTTGVEITCPTYRHNNEYLKNYSLTPDILCGRKKEGIHIPPIFRKILRIRTTDRRLYAINFIKKNNFDVFIPSYYEPYFIPYLQRPFLLIVHDMIHEIFSSEMNSADPGVAEWKQQLIGRANRIIAVSENTKYDIKKIYPNLEKEIDVCHLGYSEPQHSIQKKCIDGDYILFVGVRSLYKNFAFFIQSVSDFICSRNFKVVCTGSHPFTDSELNLFSRMGVSNRVIHRNFEEGELASLYRHAFALVFPSNYEGFGIPVLEAFGNNCPAVVSDIPVFREIAKDAALYFEKDNASKLVECLVKLETPDTRNEFISRGKRQLTNYSWDKMTAELIEAAKKVAH